MKGSKVSVFSHPHPLSLPREVLGSRWEVMELRGSVGSDMASCQVLMQANIWRLLSMSLPGSSSPGREATLWDINPGAELGSFDKELSTMGVSLPLTS